MASKTQHMAQKSTQNAQRHDNVFHVEKWDISHGTADRSRNYDVISARNRGTLKLFVYKRGQHQHVSCHSLPLQQTHVQRKWILK